MTPPSRDNAVDRAAAVHPPICDECELPMEEVTHSYVFEWACINQLCPQRFCASFEELVNPELLIILGQPHCYRCGELRTMTRIGNVVSFDCPNPSCNELIRLISAKAAESVKARAAVAAALELAAVALAGRLATLPPNEPTTGPPHLYAVPRPTPAPRPRD